MKTIFKKSTGIFMLSVCMLVMAAAIYSGCKKSSSDSSSTTTATPTCSDGIQNQGETGVDCGGPCGPCPTNVCSGNGSSQYLPLTLNNKWIYYRNYYSSCPDHDTMTVEGTETLSGKTYFKIRRFGDCFGGTSYVDFRYDGTTGNVYQYDSGVEYVFIPGSPTVGQTLANGFWFLSNSNTTRKITSLTGTVSTTGCNYTNCMVIEHRSISTGSIIGSEYFVKGVGFVKDNLDYQLNSLQLY